MRDTSPILLPRSVSNWGETSILCRLHKTTRSLLCSWLSSPNFSNSSMISPIMWPPTSPPSSATRTPSPARRVKRGSVTSLGKPLISTLTYTASTQRPTSTTTITIKRIPMSRKKFQQRLARVTARPTAPCSSRVGCHCQMCSMLRTCRS